MILSHGEDKNKPQELQSTAIDNSNGQQPSGFRAMGDNLTDDTTNGNYTFILTTIERRYQYNLQ